MFFVGMLGTPWLGSSIGGCSRHCLKRRPSWARTPGRPWVDTDGMMGQLQRSNPHSGDFECCFCSQAWFQFQCVFSFFSWQSCFQCLFFKLVQGNSDGCMGLGFRSEFVPWDLPRVGAWKTQWGPPVLSWFRDPLTFLNSNVVKTIMKHPFGNGFYHPFLVIWGMVFGIVWITINGTKPSIG